MLVQSPSPGCQPHVLEQPWLSPVPPPGDSPSKLAKRSVPSPWPLLSVAPSVCVLPSLLPCLEWEDRGRGVGTAAPSAVALPVGGDVVRVSQFLWLLPRARWRNPPSPSSLFPKPRGQLQAAPLHSLPVPARGLPSASRSPWPNPDQLGAAEAAKTEGTDLAGRREPWRALLGSLRERCCRTLMMASFSRIWA